MGVNEKIECPDLTCKSKRVIKHGLRDGRQRYLCKSCGSRFVDDPVHFRKNAIRIKLLKFLAGVKEKKTVDQICGKFGICRRTYYLWVPAKRKKSKGSQVSRKNINMMDAFERNLK